MELAPTLAAAFQNLLTDPAALFYLAVGVVVGICFGALPGLTVITGLALLLPITFQMDPVPALGMLIGVYVGGIAGGAIPAILLNIPGTPASVATALDGHPMAKSGRAGQALGWTVVASLVGGMIGWAALTLIAPQLASFALRFGPPEYAALAFLGLTVIAGVSSGSILKGVLGGMLGVSLSFVGVDPITGHMRFTFGSVHLMGGIALMPALVGLFAIPEILNSLSGKAAGSAPTMAHGKLLPGFGAILRQSYNLVRSAVIGVLIGIMPAAGSNIASFIAYFQARRGSRAPQNFGKGEESGVIAAESANNGVTGGALVPLLTLGIPGDSITAILLGGLMIHGLQPGPNLFRGDLYVVYGIFAALFVANLLMVLTLRYGIKGFVQVLRIPRHYLAPILLILAVIGVFSLNNNWFDVWVMLALGGFGFLLALGGFPLAPVVLGLVLGPLLESQTRRSLILSGGDWSIFVTRPLTLVLITLALLVLFGAPIANWLRQRRKGASGTGA